MTALETGAVEPQIAELLYRQFVVTGFSTQGPQGERYESARSTFGGILGLKDDKMKEIQDGIGTQVYENFINNAMRTKGTLDQQDMMFLANIKNKLNTRWFLGVFLGIHPRSGMSVMAPKKVSGA